MKFIEKSLRDNYLVFGLIVISVCLPKGSYGYKIDEQQHNLDSSNTQIMLHRQIEKALQNEYDMFRMKREVESMDNYMDGVSGEAQTEEEEGFWSRVMRAALKVLKSVMAWLNT